MIISWEALKKVTRNATKATTHGLFEGDVRPSQQITSTSMIWETSIHPRRRPRKGRVNLSRKGAQRNLTVYGRPTRAIKPITVRSTPSSFIQACKTEMVSRSGRPQENPISRVLNIRLLKITFSISGIVFPGRE
jgi:hypothetical protein